MDFFDVVLVFIYFIVLFPFLYAIHLTEIEPWHNFRINKRKIRKLMRQTWSK